MNIKKLSIFFLILIILLLFSVKSFAVTFTDNEGVSVELPDFTDLAPYDFIITNYGSHYFLITFNSENPDKYISIKNVGNSNCNVFYYVDEDTLGTYNVYDCFLGDESWTSQSANFHTTRWDIWNIVDFVYSTKPVFDVDNEVTFFHHPPLSNLAKIVEGAKIWETLFQIVKILPLILVVVVSYLGLRKAWRILSMLLHQA